MAAAIAAGQPPDPEDERECRDWVALLQLIKEMRLWRAVFRIPPIPWPPPDPYRVRPEELTTLPGIRDLLINELIIDALRNTNPNPGLFKDIRESGAYKDVLKGLIGQFETATKDLQEELSML